MFSCKDVTEKANQYIDQELPLGARLKVQLHLFVCVNCRQYIKQLHMTINALGRMRKPADDVTRETSFKSLRRPSLKSWKCCRSKTSREIPSPKITPE